MKNLIFSVFVCFFGHQVHAEVNLIPFQYGGEAKTEIPTVYWSKANSEAVVIFLPGGSGSFGITKRVNPRPNWVLADLYNSTDGLTVDLVFMDSDTSLQADFGNPYARWAARRDSRHVDRIKATVLYYQAKTGKPVFLFGHSNGSLSAAEFLKSNPDHQKLLGGVIFSGSRNETELKTPLSIAVLVIHHRSDPNRWTSPNSAENLFSSLKAINTGITELNWVEGGKDVVGGDPTHTGRHMYNEATDEASKLIQTFIAKAVKK